MMIFVLLKNFLSEELEKLDLLWKFVSVLTDFRSLNCRDPSRNFEENDKRVLSELRNSVLKRFNVEDDILPEEYLEYVTIYLCIFFIEISFSSKVEYRTISQFEKFLFLIFVWV